MSPNHWMSGVLFAFLPGTLFITIQYKMYSVFNCVESTATVLDTSVSPAVLVNVTEYWLGAEPSIQCWTGGQHRTLMFAATFALALYSSTANFVGASRRVASRCTLPR